MTGTCTSCHQTGKLARRDLCRNCYQQHWRADTLPELPPLPRVYAQPVDCAHDGRHQHGTRTMYVWDRCRCEPCVTSNRQGATNLRRQKAIAQWNPDASPFVDGDVVRAHLRELMDAGMGWKRIATAAGIYPSTVYPILYGKRRDNPTHPEHRPPRKQVRRAVATKLLAVHLDLASGALLDSAGTRRRLQALVAIGWSQSRLAARLGMTLANFGKLIHRQGQVTKATAAAVVALYDELWNATPTAGSASLAGGITRAKKVAQGYGWPPPMAWDDDTIDDPAARPDLGDELDTTVNAVTLARIEDVRELLEVGESPTAIANRLGLTINAVAKTLERHAPELAPPFWRFRNRSAA